jgi:ferredoxin, 2Fe-2S
MVAINVTDRSGQKQTLQVPATGTLMEVLRDKNLGVDAICGGSCSCATCHVYIDTSWSAKLPARSEEEKELVESSDHFKGDESRLSCQIPLSDALNGITVTVAPPD